MANSASGKQLSVKRLLLIFCVITILIIGLLTAKTAGPETWRAISEMKSIYLLLAFFLGAMMISVNAVIIKALVRASGKKIGFLYSTETVLSYYFLSSISPTLTGGEPLMIYMLTKGGVPLGKSFSITLVRGILVLLVIVIAAPITIYFRGDLIQNDYLRKFFYVIAFVILVAAALIAYAFKNPKKMERMIHRIRIKISRWKILSRYAATMEKRVDVWIEDFGSSLKNFLRYQKTIILAVVVLTMVSLSANYLIAYAILSGLGFQISPIDVVMIQFVLYFFLYFAPTPGGSGVAEGGAYVMFSAFVPSHLLGVFVILWRFFTTYLWLILGGIFVTKTLGLNILDEIPKSTLKNKK